MSKKFQLSIPTPCHENWDNMTPIDKGRFCGSCQKQVVDFSKMSDREIAMFFKKPSTNSVCGRFMEDQLDRNIEIPKKRIPWIKYFFQILIPGYLISCTNDRTIGKVKAAEFKTETVNKSCSPTTGMVMLTPELVQTPDTAALIPNENIFTGDVAVCISKLDTGYSKPVTVDTIATKVLTIPISKDSIGENIEPITLKENLDIVTVNGKVVDEKDNPIPYASVMIKGTAEGIYAKQDGTFSIQTQLITKDILSFSSIGFESKEIELKNYEQRDTLIVQLNSLSSILGEVVIVKRNDLITCKATTGLVSVIKKPIDKINVEIKNNSVNSFKVFPNPVQSGTSLNIEWKQSETGEYMLQIFNQAGQLTFNKEMWIDDEARVLNLEVPHVAAGNYFLRMTSKSSGKAFTEKIIIQ